MLQIQKKKIKLLIPLLCSGVLVLSGLPVFGALTTYAAGGMQTLADITTMQQMTQQICSNSKVGDTKTLTDTRDNNTYTVRKHEDGNCWMTQNLRLAGEKTLTPADSDVKSDYTLPASSVSGFDSTNNYANQMYYAGDETNGAYYSWTAATAGTGDASLTKGEAPSSVCPKGWKLPPNAGNGSYTAFVTAAGITNDAAGSTKISSAPYNFPYAGYTDLSSLNYVGSWGYYWSRTASSSTNAYDLYFDSSNVNPANYNLRFRYYGFSVRCVAVSGRESADTDIAVSVEPILTIDAVTDMHEIANTASVTTGTIDATISANTNYKVLLSAAEPDLINETNPEASIPASANVAAGTSAWGVATGNTTTPYLAMTSNPTEYPNTTAVGRETSQTVHKFGVGVSVSSLLPSGVYSTVITVTATAI